MSEVTQPHPSDSLLHSDLLLRVLGGDAMQILRCGICMEFFDVPIVLPCGHTFCLRCLTEMCKHASRNCVLSPLKDLRIGCPNCRVLIYASPILERNVTCNFIIQSLIECLRAREGGKRLSIGINTEEIRVGPKIRAVSDLEMDRVIKEVDRLTEALGKHNVLDNAYLEVEEIRQRHWADQARRQQEEEEEQHHRAWNLNRSTQPFSIQLQLSHHQVPFSQQQQHQQRQQQQQQQQRPKAYSWEDLNGQGLTLTQSSSFHRQQQQQQPNLQQHFKLQQHSQSQQQQQQQTSQFQFRMQIQQQPQQQHQLQQHQQQQAQVQSSLAKISKMATVLPLQRCPDIGQFSGAINQYDLPSGHLSGLDIDPAIMSYSYKAAVSPVINNNK